MGVDFYQCKNPKCGNTYPDCGDYFTCSCEQSFCSDECGGRKDADGENEETGESNSTCVLCRLDVIEPKALVVFLAGRLAMTVAEAEDLYREEGEK